MDHFLTFKRATIGPLFNFTAHTHIYIYLSLSFSLNPIPAYRVFGWNRNHVLSFYGSFKSFRSIQK